ncbi:MAG TPA: ATP synthase subunit I [Rhodoblastus sp.]|nr:ATP synthase subunit I [Rhodoblastus sp.]
MSALSGPLGEVLRLAAIVLLGAGGGALYFHAVWRNARALAQRAGTCAGFAGAGFGATVLAMFGRFALMAVGLGLASRGGPGPLLAAAWGVLLARFLVVRRLKDRAT